MEKKFCTVNVSGNHGYSFLAIVGNDMEDAEVINQAKERCCFNDAEDAQYATVDWATSEQDYEFFKKHGAVCNLR